jgi:FkbM family methyltransferase
MPNLKLYKIKSEILLRKFGNRFGVDVKMTDEEILMKQINNNNIDLIFDIGANEGQFAELIFKMGFKGRIVSFEPLTSAYKILFQKSEKYTNWEVAERFAIGESDGEIILHISENTLSSSALDILEEHTKAAPDSVYTGEEKVKVYKLDTIGKKYLKDSKNIFLKIDTQGFEEKILNGANKFLKDVKGILVETSLVKLYEGQALFPKIYSMIIEKGFELWGMEPAFINKETGRMLQADAIFFR